MVRILHEGAKGISGFGHEYSGFYRFEVSKFEPKFQTACDPKMFERWMVCFHLTLGRV